jgi:hypothetical protein
MPRHVYSILAERSLRTVQRGHQHKVRHSLTLLERALHGWVWNLGRLGENEARQVKRPPGASWPVRERPSVLGQTLDSLGLGSGFVALHPPLTHSLSDHPGDNLIMLGLVRSVCTRALKPSVGPNRRVIARSKPRKLSQLVRIQHITNLTWIWLLLLLVHLFVSPALAFPCTKWRNRLIFPTPAFNASIWPTVAPLAQFIPLIGSVTYM